jgi:hypothetical protein
MHQLNTLCEVFRPVPPDIEMSGSQKEKCAKGTLSVSLADLALRQPDNLLSGDKTN